LSFYLQLPLQRRPLGHRISSFSWQFLWTLWWGKIWEWAALYVQSVGTDVRWFGLCCQGVSTTRAQYWWLDHLQWHGGIHHECCINFQRNAKTKVLPCHAWKPVVFSLLSERSRSSVQDRRWCASHEEPWCCCQRLRIRRCYPPPSCRSLNHLTHRLMQR